MGNLKNQRKRNQSAITRGQTNKENVAPKIKPKPRPIKPKSSSKASEDNEFDSELVNAAAALVEMSAKVPASSAKASRPRFDGMVDEILGIGPEEAAELDLDPDAGFGIDEHKNVDDELEVDELNTDSDGLGDDKENTEGFCVKYEVPYKNASRDVMLKLTTSWDEFILAIANKMEVRVSLLTKIIGYIPSYKPKNSKPVPKLLEDEESYEAMMDDIEEYIEGCKSKNRGKGAVKPFSIRIIDMSENSDDGSAGKEATAKKKGTKEPAAPLEDDLDQEHKLIKQIEQCHACSDHKGRACYILDDGKHYQFTNADLTIWATLLRRHLATIDTPPAKLNLVDKLKKQETLKIQGNTVPPWLSAPPQTPPPWMMYGYPPWMMSQATPPGLGLYNTPEHHTIPAQASIPSYDMSPMQPSRKRSAESSIPVIKYPTSHNWLSGLDTHEERGQDRLNYAQYIDSFVNAGLI